jgi:tetratricopeptide (TPR) repeat protein
VLSEALPLAEELEDVENQISLLGSLGLCNIRLNKPAVAQRYYERRLSLAQDREDTMTIGVTMGGLGNAHALLGQYRVALDYFKRARAYFAEQEGANNALAYADASIAKAAQRIGDELVEYVSRSIAERLAIVSDEGAKQQPQDREYPGDLKQDVL